MVGYTRVAARVEKRTFSAITSCRRVCVIERGRGESQQWEGGAAEEVDLES
jgi:hypothetical protein